MKVFVTFLFTFLMLNCSNKVMKPVSQEETFTKLYEGSLPGAGEEGFIKENIVIKSESDWKVFCEKLKSSDFIYNRLSSADIDFSKKTAIIVVDAVRNTGGFSIKVNKIQEDENALNVYIQRTSPSPQGMAIMVITQPIQIITIDKTKKKIVFKEG